MDHQTFPHLCPPICAFMPGCFICMEVPFIEERFATKKIRLFTVMRERDKKLSLALSVVWCLILLLVSSVVKIISAVTEVSEWLFLSGIFFCFLLTWQNTYRARHCHGCDREACCSYHMPEWQWYWWEDCSLSLPLLHPTWSALTYSGMLQFCFFISQCHITLHRKKMPPDHTCTNS